MSEREKSVFHVMCDMWGIEIAIKKAKQLGIDVSQEAIDEQRSHEEQLYNSWKAFLDAISEKEDEKNADLQDR